VDNASKLIGFDTARIDAGLQAETVKDAFDTVTAQGVDAVIDPALPNPLAQSGLEALNSKGIPAVGIGVVNGDRKLLPAIVGSEVALSRLAEVTASYMVATYGNDLNTVFYTVPELELTSVMYDAFEKKVKELCPDCKVRSADIPVAALGTTASTVVTDDLQAHPDTKQATFSTGEEAIGLPAAMKSAGIDVDTIAAGPGPDSFQQIKDGEMKAGIGYDLTYAGWAAVDSAARLALGQEPSKGVKDDVIPMQILTADSVTDDMIKMGWSAYPDIADRFAKIWGVK
jgi:ribose transport system substrate-binding protein